MYGSYRVKNLMKMNVANLNRAKPGMYTVYMSYYSMYQTGFAVKVWNNKTLRSQVIKAPGKSLTSS